jgi:hypothetical protein
MLVRTFAAALLAAALHAQAPQYVGSAACKTCHAKVHGRCSKTRMANVVHDPRQHPDAITPDLNKPRFQAASEFFSMARISSPWANTSGAQRSSNRCRVMAVSV